MNEEQGLLEEGDEEPCGNSIVVVLVFVHVCFLCKHKGRVLEAYKAIIR